MFSKTFVLSLSIGVVRDVSFVRCSNFENLKFTGICLQKFVLQLEIRFQRDLFDARGASNLPSGSRWWVVPG